MRSRLIGIAALSVAVTLFTAGCQGTSGTGEPAAGAQEAVKVGVILPETDGSCQWECIHKPALETALKAEGLDPDIQNAAGDEQKYATIADGMISSGVGVLIIAALSTEVGATVEAKAKANGIPVIEYDRLVAGGTGDYYVSFDGNEVGVLQAQALSSQLEDKKGAEIIEIEGSPTDNNAKLFYDGQQTVMKPLYTSGALKLVGSRYIDKWDDQLAATTFEQFLTGNRGKVDGVLSANDGFANAAITVLKKYGLNGKVPITGQDATIPGLQNILRGDQYMTVYKDIRKEASAAADLAGAIAKGDTAGADKIANETVTDTVGDREVKTVLIKPESITKDKVASVVESGFVKASDLCTGDLESICAEAGIK